MGIVETAVSAPILVYNSLTGSLGVLGGTLVAGFVIIGMLYVGILILKGLFTSNKNHENQRVFKQGNLVYALDV